MEKWIVLNNYTITIMSIVTTNVEQFLVNTKLNVISKMNEYGLVHDSFMKELSK
jgi:hypothetical protein